MATYIHEPLPDPNRYIRLLEVIKLDDNEVEGLRIQVHCRLTVWPLQGLPSYSALSYTWGNETDTRPILVDGKVMLVSRNCEYALKQAKEYSSRRQRYLWCDAICIIQKTDGINIEKNHQVRLMGEVYRGAKQVLACIGE
ncbi:HET-domain-containing protein, partial [Macroventuria anomochaeta]